MYSFFSSSFFGVYSITHFQLFDIAVLSCKRFNHKFVQHIEDLYGLLQMWYCMTTILMMKKITTKFHRSEIGIPNGRDGVRNAIAAAAVDEYRWPTS